MPIRRATIDADDDLTSYLTTLVRLVPVVVADGSPPAVFARHAALWPPEIVHLAVDADRCSDLNGKVAGVVTGLRRVRTAKAVIADDDVRYDAFSLGRIARLLDGADVVLPQNVFDPAPWHTVLDGGRTLIARATGGDWPGTIGLRMRAYHRAGDYDGDVLFENLELVRTMLVTGASVVRADDLFVPRRPPTAQRYLQQRVRQAYDELARPARMTAQLLVGPALAVAAARFGRPTWPVFAALSIALAEAGRRRARGTRAFPLSTAIAAPVWVLERAVTSWVALGLRVARGGVRYSNGTLRRAANSERALRARYRDAGRGVRRAVR
ncbi:MAG TPA: hypothetical protein VHT05_05355 [Candidatus Elarobacter sp.]|nr:hypothetical protein [Candidatus Elarobacter sp.]